MSRHLGAHRVYRLPREVGALLARPPPWPVPPLYTSFRRRCRVGGPTPPGETPWQGVSPSGLPSLEGLVISSRQKEPRVANPGGVISPMLSILSVGISSVLL